MKDKIKKIIVWTFRIVMFLVLDSLISIVALASLGYIEVLEVKDLMGWEFYLSFILASLGILWLTVANFFYWILDINLFDFKSIFKKIDSPKGRKVKG